MANGSSYPKGLWAVIGVCATVAVSSLTGGWVAGRAYLSDELEQLRRSKDWRLPENLEALGKLSNAVALHLGERRELEELRKRAPQLTKELDASRQQVTALSAENAEMKQRLAALEGDTFELREGESRFIVPNRLALGVSDVSEYGHSVSVNLGTESAHLSPGEPVTTELKGMVYTITFVKLNDRAAVFTSHTGPADARRHQSAR